MVNDPDINLNGFTTGTIVSRSEKMEGPLNCTILDSWLFDYLILVA